MKGTKIISAFLAAVLLSSACSIPVLNTAIAAESTKKEDEKTLIYRESVKGKCEGITYDGSKWDFIYALTAYNNGQIHIDVQCEKSNSNTCNKIGDIQFNDSMIAAIEEKGYAGTSSFDNSKHQYAAKYTTSFSGTDIVYTAIYSNGESYLAGETLMSFDLYVKEKYLKTNQKIGLFGTEIEIPFGEPPIDKDKKIAELEEEIAKLKADPSVLQDDISRLDANGDGAVNAVDASIVLTIYAYNSTNNTKIKSFSDYNAIFNK